MSPSSPRIPTATQVATPADTLQEHHKVVKGPLLHRTARHRTHQMMQNPIITGNEGNPPLMRTNVLQSISTLQASLRDLCFSEYRDPSVCSRQERVLPRLISKYTRMTILSLTRWPCNIQRFEGLFEGCSRSGDFGAVN